MISSDINIFGINTMSDISNCQIFHASPRK